MSETVFKHPKPGGWLRAWFSEAPPTSTQPFVPYWRCTSIGKYDLVHADCPLSRIQGHPLFRSSKCTASMGIVVGTLTVVRYMVDVRQWECPLTCTQKAFMSSPSSSSSSPPFSPLKIHVHSFPWPVSSDDTRTIWWLPSKHGWAFGHTYALGQMQCTLLPPHTVHKGRKRERRRYWDQRRKSKRRGRESKEANKNICSVHKIIVHLHIQCILGQNKYGTCMYTYTADVQ